MEDFKKREQLKPYFEQSYGCAAFDRVGKAGIFAVGGAFGSGRVYKFVNGTPEATHKTDLMQISVGWILGGEVYSEIIFFETEKDYNNFISGNFEFSADAKVTGLTATASAKATTMGNQGIQVGINADKTEVKGIGRDTALEFTKGMKVFTLTMGGLMYQATVAGQKFNIKPL